MAKPPWDSVLHAKDVRRPQLSKNQLKEKMKDYYKQMERYLELLKNKKEQDYDSDDVTDASDLRAIRLSKQIINQKMDMRTWAYLIKWGILVTKPGNRSVAIIHRKSGTCIYYMTLSHKARVPRKGYVKMSLHELRSWYYSNEDKYATGYDVPPNPHVYDFF